jgi:cytochrome c
MKTVLSVCIVCFSLLVCQAVVSAADGNTLYAKCQGCHGADGSKATMGTGKPIKGLSEADAYKALAGYKAGTFGGDKKAMMEGQVKSLSDDDLKALSQFISKL